MEVFLRGLALATALVMTLAYLIALELKLVLEPAVEHFLLAQLQMEAKVTLLASLG